MSPWLWYFSFFLCSIFVYEPILIKKKYIWLITLWIRKFFSNFKVIKGHIRSNFKIIFFCDKFFVNAQSFKNFSRMSTFFHQGQKPSILNFIRGIFKVGKCPPNFFHQGHIPHGWTRLWYHHFEAQLYTKGENRILGGGGVEIIWNPPLMECLFMGVG